MSQESKDHPSGVRLSSIMKALTATYGNLAEPNYRKIFVTLAGPRHRGMIPTLQSHGVDVLETTDHNDDVSTQLVASRAGDEVGLGLSGVGPFAAVIHGNADGRRPWVTRAETAPTPLAALVVACIEQAGFYLLDRDIVTRKVAMNRWDGETEATLYQALFTDTDWIP